VSVAFLVVVTANAMMKPIEIMSDADPQLVPAHGKERDDQLQSEFGSNNFVYFDGGYIFNYTLKSHVIGDGVEFDDTSFYDDWVVVRAVRSGSKPPAQAFASGLTTKNVLCSTATLNQFPGLLNFEVIGDLTFGNPKQANSITLPNFRMAQGHNFLFQNNWWLGAEYCYWQAIQPDPTKPNTRGSIVCTITDSTGKSRSAIFSQQGPASRFNVAFK